MFIASCLVKNKQNVHVFSTSWWDTPSLTGEQRSESGVARPGCDDGLPQQSAPSRRSLVLSFQHRQQLTMVSQLLTETGSRDSTYAQR